MRRLAKGRLIVYIPDVAVSCGNERIEGLALGLPVWDQRACWPLTTTGGTRAIAHEGAMIPCNKMGSVGYLAHFWTRVREDANNCWLWTGYRSASGYGCVTIRENRQYAHRIAWSFSSTEDIPRGMFVCHRCDNPPCCNPSHLFIGTHQENVSDADRKSRLWHQKQTHCRSGQHKIPPASVRKATGGARCGECRRMRDRERRAEGGAECARRRREYLLAWKALRRTTQPATRRPA